MDTTLENNTRNNSSNLPVESVDISKNNQSNKPANRVETGRNPDGTFKVGYSGNPDGRPKGGLKDYDRKKFQEMSDEQKEEFLSKMTNELRYRMAEGNPHTTTGTKLEGEITLNISKEIADKYEEK